MKTFKYIALLAITLFTLACEKDEDRVVLNSNPGTPDIITPAPNSAYVLTAANDKQTIQFVWKEPNYGFSASAAYNILADTPEGNFVKPQKLLSSVSYNDSALVTYKALNTAALALKLKAGEEGVLKVKVISVLAGDTLHSAAINIKVTPY
ncbi:MAG TPA: SusE domain-containing protein [Bacteroidales bacterium]|nr:SusE domain-containing protein [Bacteroidales bacterium]